jgi:hypothetical protein
MRKEPTMDNTKRDLWKKPKTKTIVLKPAKEKPKPVEAPLTDKQQKGRNAALKAWETIRAKQKAAAESKTAAMVPVAAAK